MIELASSQDERQARQQAKQEAINKRLTSEQQAARQSQILKQLQRDREKQEQPEKAAARKQAEREAHKAAEQEAYKIAKETEGSQRITVRTGHEFEPDSVTSQSRLTGTSSGRQQKQENVQVAGLSAQDARTYEALKQSAPGTAKAFLETKRASSQPQRQTVTQGLTITGGPPESDIFKLRRGALTSEQLDFVRQKEREENLKYFGEASIDRETGDIQFFFISREAGKEYRKQFFETKEANREIVEANAAEQARYTREVARIKSEAKDLGYEAVPTKTDSSGNPIEFEYRPIPGQPQYRYEQNDPTNPFAGTKKVEIKDPVVEMFEGFREEYKPRDTGPIGQVGEFGYGIRTQAESIVEPVGIKPEAPSALNTLFGIEQYKGKYERLPGESEGQFKTRVRSLEAEAARKQKEAPKPETKLDERGRPIVPKAMMTAASPGSPEYQKQEVFKAIQSNPARFAGELYAEAGVALAGGEVIGQGAKGVGAASKAFKGIQRVEITPPRVTVRRFGSDPLKTGIKTEPPLVKGELEFTAPKVKITKKPEKPASPKPEEVSPGGALGSQTFKEPIKTEVTKTTTELPPAGSIAKDILKGKPSKPKSVKPKESKGSKQVTILEEKPKETIGKRFELPKQTKKNLQVKRRIESEIAKDTAQAGIITTATVRRKQGAVTIVKEKPSILIEQPKGKRGAPVKVTGYPKVYDIEKPAKVAIKKKKKQESLLGISEGYSIVDEQLSGGKQDFLTGRQQAGMGAGGLIELPQVGKGIQQPRQPRRGRTTTPATVPIVKDKPVFTPAQQLFTATTTGPKTTTTGRDPYLERIGRSYRRPPAGALPGGFGPGGIGLDDFVGQTSVKQIGTRNPLFSGGGLDTTPEAIAKQKKKGLLSDVPLFGTGGKKGKGKKGFSLI